MFQRLATLALATAATVAAQSAIVTIEASHGGAGNGLTNTTITVPLNTRYTNSALQTVSTLYLTGAEGVALDSITCTPYTSSNSTGPAPFTSSSPSLLSTNTVQVGYLLCNASDSSSTTSGTTSSSNSVTSTTSASTTLTPPSMANGTLIPVGSASPRSTATSVFLTTLTGPSGSQSTLTSTALLTEGGSPTDSASSVTTTEASSTSSAPPSLNSDSAGTKMAMGDWMLQGAIAGAGFLAML